MATTRFADHLLIGDHASRPAATTVPAGGLYSCTTHSKIYQSDGTSWSDYVTSLVGPTGATGATGATGPTGATGASGSAASVSSDAIWDTKGDLAVATAADTAAKLVVGSDGQVLVADSSQTTGIKWGAVPSGSGGAMTLLSTTTLGSAGTFNITGISGSYNDLRLVAITRGARASATETLLLQFNGDTASHYGAQAILGSSGSVGGGENASTTNVNLRTVPAATGTANAFGLHIIDIPGYSSTTWNKSIVCLSSGNDSITTSNLRSQVISGLWASTAAITSVQLFGSSVANLVAGSQVRIYGIT